MNQSNNKDLDLEKIFFPHYSDKLVETKNKKFVYYTNAETASNIIKRKEIWMRNVRCMNDYSEVKYGLKKIEDIYSNSEEGSRFKSTLNGIFYNITGDIERAFDQCVNELKTNTYITCISEHLPDEDLIGRLSMWRAYGKNAGIAIVINSEIILPEHGLLPVVPSPVGYFGVDEFKCQFTTITDNIVANINKIKPKMREEIIQNVLNMFVFGSLCAKHPGFTEEREWRLVYCPKLFMRSGNLEKEILSVNGIPQFIYKIPLKEKYNSGLDALLEKVIIGPARYSSELHKAFVGLLKDAGVSNSEEKVVNSNIPLRC